MRQYAREYLDAYVKRFYEKELDFYDPAVEDVLVDVSLHGMIKDYKIYPENLSFSSFSKLMRLRCEQICQKDLKVQFADPIYSNEEADDCDH